MRYDSVSVHFGRYGNRVSAGTMEMLWLTRTKTPAHWSRKMKHNNALQNWKTSTLSRKENKKLSYAWEDHVLNINLCVKFVIPLIFTEIQRKGITLFNKNNGVNLMYRRFIYVSMELWKALPQGHFIFVIFNNFTIESVPITVVRWLSRGKFVLGLTYILFVNNTSRYINTMVCACHFLVEWEGFSFAHYLWNTWHHWFVVFPIVTAKCTVATRTRQPFDTI